MAIKILSTEFTDFTGRSLTYLKGNAFDYMQKLQYDIEVDFASNINASNPMTKNGNTFTLTTAEWKDYGFLVGQTLTFTGFTGGAPKSGIVSIIDGDTLVISGGSAVSIPNGTYTKGVVRLVQLPEVFDFFFNLVPSNGNANELSLIDGEVQRFRGVDVNTALAVVGNTMSLSRFGKASGGSQMSVTLERLPDSGGIFRFRVYSPFRIWLANQPALFQSVATIEPFAKFVAYPDSDALKSNIQTINLEYGDCGYVDEAYNGGQPNFSVDYIEWTDASSNSLSAFDYNQDSYFEIKIDNLTGSFTASHEFNFFFFLDPKDDAVYKNKLLAHENNVMLISDTTPIPMGSTLNIGGETNEDGAQVSVRNLTFTNNTTHVIVTGYLQTNQAFKDYMESREAKDRIYKLWIRCEKPSLPYDLSDALNVEVDRGIAIKTPLPLGNYPDLNFLDIENHNGDILTGAPILKDDVILISRFTFPKFSNPINWTGAVLRVVAQKTTGEQFTLDEVEYAFGGTPNIADGTRPLNFSSPRGFQLPASSDKLASSLKRFTALDTGSDFGIEFKFPFLVRWEYWIEQLNANSDFFGVNTKNWREYDIATDWDVLCQLVIKTPDGNYTDEKTFLADLRTYNDWAHTSSISFEKLDGTPITNPIAGEIVKVIATHTISGDTWTGNEWGQITIEEFEDQPNYYISSVLNHGNQPNNPLQPLSGETKLKQTIDGGLVEITHECLLDTSLLASNQVTLTARVNGNTLVAGTESNRYTLTTAVSPKPVVFEEEERGFDKCCEPFIVLVDTTDNTSWKNDVTSAFDRGDSIVFRLKKSDGSTAIFTPVVSAFVNDSEAYYTTINWRDVVGVDGYDCYTLEYDVTYAGLTETKFWGEYDVQPYKIDDYRLSEGQVRLLSVFNDYNKKIGINFTGSFVQDTIRFKGKFGYWQPNTEIDNVQYTDDVMKKVRREDLFDYELRVDPQYEQVMERILFHLVAENTCFVSDYNRDNYTYKYLDFPVIVKEGFNATHFDGARKVKGVAKFEDKTRKSQTNHQNFGEKVEVLNVAPVADAVFIKGVFDVGVTDLPTLTIDADNKGTFTTISDDGGSGTITISVNGGSYVAFSSPLALEVGDTLDVKRTISTAVGFFKITGTLL